jgi:serine/threonine protein kinase
MSEVIRTGLPDQGNTPPEADPAHPTGTSTGAAAAPSPAVGYDLGEEIGRGGMGVVYRARDRGLDREVAVKILQDKYAPDSGTAARFVEEARITGQLQHPGIPAVYQVGTWADGRPFLAMKLIKGRTLADLLKDQGPHPTRWLGPFEALCHAVGYAHAHTVIHRDLKPANVMVGKAAGLRRRRIARGP